MREDLYDLYLRALEEGRAEDPDRFLARHTVGGCYGAEWGST